MVRKTTTIKKIGNSHFVLLPKIWIDSHKLEDRSHVLLDINEDIIISAIHE